MVVLGPNGKHVMIPLTNDFINKYTEFYNSIKPVKSFPTIAETLICDKLKELQSFKQESEEFRLQTLRLLEEF